MDMRIHDLLVLISRPGILLLMLLFSVNSTAEKNSFPEPLLMTGIIDTNYTESINLFEKTIKNLIGKLKIPSVSVAVVKSGKIIYARGFGYSDPVRKIPATENTLYHLASITKTFAASIILSLVDKGLIKTSDFAKNYGINVPEDVRIKHLMSHTSNFEPGKIFYYNSTRFGFLGNIMEKVTGKGFAVLLLGNILNPLGMTNTYPNPASESFSFSGKSATEISKMMAKAYKLEKGNLISTQYPSGFSPGAGMVSNVMDLAKYAIALENYKLFSKEISDEAYSPTITKTGDTLPYGLGWFVQTVYNKKVIWHYGDWKANSSLLMRIPEDSLTLILLANTDGLSAPFMGLGLPGDITFSPFALAFLRIFVFSNFDDAFNIEYSKLPSIEVIEKYRDKLNLTDLVKDIIAMGEIEAELFNEKGYLDLMKPLYKLFITDDLSVYTGKYKTESFIIRIKSEKGILKATFDKREKIKKKAVKEEEPVEYYIFPENKNIFYMNDYMKIKIIEKIDNEVRKIELIKLGKPEPGKRI
jgi:CubicO group peptidase (beta-lactamase class C family)